MSTIAAGTTTTTALVQTADTTGSLIFQTNGTTTALTLDTSQNATFVGAGTATAFIPTGSSVPANGLYLSAANTIAFSSNTTIRASVNSTGNWTINAPSSGQALTITAATGGATNGGIVVNGSGNTPSSAVTFSATAMTVDCTKSNVFTTTLDRKSTRLNSSHIPLSRMPSSA